MPVVIIFKYLGCMSVSLAFYETLIKIFDGIFFIFNNNSIVDCLMKFFIHILANLQFKAREE